MANVTSFTVTSSTSEQTLAFLEALLSSGAIAPLADPGESADRPGPSVEYQSLINSIPVAHDGEVIEPRFHNSLRDALAVVARQLDETAFQRVVTVVSLPVLQPVIGDPEWRIGFGAALGPDTSTGLDSANGWMQLDLPHGTHLETVTVHGDRSGDVVAWAAGLTRIEATSGDTVQLGMRNDLQTADEGSFAETFDITAPNRRAGTAEALRTIDNTRYRYVFTSEVAGVGDGVDARINAIEVTCSRW
jgi:hypothetical protein